MVAVSRILDPATGKPFVKKGSRRMSSRYDNAQTVDDNRRHWANADVLSARAANSLDVRIKLRSRSRYEQGNNGYVGGLPWTLANDIVGTGPKLQVRTGDRATNSAVEEAWKAWDDATGFSSKLHTAGMAKHGDGEGFLVAISNPDIVHLDGTPCPVQFDLLDLECDYFSTPGSWGAMTGNSRWVDGIEFDERGKPTFYHVLRNHPGDTFWWGVGSWTEFDRVPARDVIHWFRKCRPGQLRGVPENTPGLGIAAQLRRWTLATLTAAETAASFSAVLETPEPPDADDSQSGTEPDPAMTFEIVRNMMARLPDGVKMSQFKSEHPQTTYPMLKGELLKELGRPNAAPYAVTAGDSSPYNFSSAKMDMGAYQKACKIERETCRRTVLERAFGFWYREARLVPGYLPRGLPERIPHRWRWDGWPSIDPLKDAKADTERLANGTLSYDEYFSEQGKDYEEEFDQQAIEQAMRRRKKLAIVGAPATAVPIEEPGEDDPGSDADEESGYDQAARPTRYRLRAEVRR